MWKSRKVSCFVIALLLTVNTVNNAYAVEFSTDRILTEVQQNSGNQNSNQPCIDCEKPSIPSFAPIPPIKPLPPIKSVQENPSGKITVTYKDIPVTVPASKVTNVIRVPYQIKSLGSSKFCPEKLTSSSCINPDNIGKSEHQITVVPVMDADTDFAIATEKKTFLISLRPVLDTPAYIEIKDEGSSVIINKAAEDFERAFPYVEGLLEIIKKARRNEQIDGYITKHTSVIHETPDLFFILRKEMTGARYKVVYIDILNKTNNIIQLREDSELLQTVVARMAGSPLASNLSREFIQPRTPETERKGEHISTLISVVRRSASDR